ncbi:hypothetical protein E2C01_080426 [Portunus trituberculatus]|uniref:Uncharacterized protein n=1 Tax=Portunus trituberculatus TaxID=210409 RepID=A0A5B7IZL2_PORTR|nr:hypothetical protein [Portunus trituberculatus]
MNSRNTVWHGEQEYSMARQAGTLRGMNSRNIAWRGEQEHSVVWTATWQEYSVA